MDAAQIIKETLSMPDVLDAYGFRVGRGGFMPCPFHSGDRDPSLKVYSSGRSWHCFGCGKGGSVIDFVMQLHGITFYQAIIRIDNDFHLGVVGKKADTRTQMIMARERARRQQETLAKEMEYNSLLEKFALIDRFLSTNQPSEETGGDFGFLMAEREKLWMQLQSWHDNDRKEVQHWMN